MVTLLGVRSMVERKASECSLLCKGWSSGGVVGAVLESSCEGVAELRSADMVWLPLSRRGLFLVEEESASSMEFRCGGLGPADDVYLGLEGVADDEASITPSFSGD